jgi:hypothetical protein
MTPIAEYLWNELGATSAHDYQVKRTALFALLQVFRQRFENIQTVDEWLELCLEFAAQCPHERPIQIMRKPLAPQEHTRLIQQLSTWGYPADYIDWAERYGDYYLWLESTQIEALRDLEEEIKFWKLLAENGYFYFTKSASGDPYLFDLNQKEFSIRIARHDGWCDYDFLDNIYTTHYDLIWNEEIEEWQDDEQNPVVGLVDAIGSPIGTNSYIKKYLAKAQ